MQLFRIFIATLFVLLITPSVQSRPFEAEPEHRSPSQVIQPIGGVHFAIPLLATATGQSTGPDRSAVNEKSAPAQSIQLQFESGAAHVMAYADAGAFDPINPGQCIDCGPTCPWTTDIKCNVADGFPVGVGVTDYDCCFCPGESAPEDVGVLACSNIAVDWDSQNNRFVFSSLNKGNGDYIDPRCDILSITWTEAYNSFQFRLLADEKGPIEISI